MPVFVPLSVSELAALAGGGRLADRLAWAATPALAADLGGADDDLAAWTALAHASVEGLAAHGVRLVAVAAAPLAGETEPGRGRVAELVWPAVTAVFADDPAAAADVAALAPIVAGLDLAAALGQPGVARFAAEAPLLWYDATEVGRGLVTAVAADGLQVVATGGDTAAASR
ncbi:MAG: hypothetical protein LBH76_06345 [Propionibacteriaceae bacterium]|jgi:hypothetical protein|nr:hypothetical protein [Propionibacteriaceae bacterium]